MSKRWCQNVERQQMSNSEKQAAQRITGEEFPSKFSVSAA